MNLYILPCLVVVLFSLGLCIFSRKPSVPRWLMVIYWFGSTGVYGYFASMHRYDFGFGVDLVYVSSSVVGVLAAMYLGFKIPPRT
jgi:hypothetical protein